MVTSTGACRSARNNHSRQRCPSKDPVLEIHILPPDSSSSETWLGRRKSWEGFIALAQLPAKQICHLTPGRLRRAGRHARGEHEVITSSLTPRGFRGQHQGVCRAGCTPGTQCAPGSVTAGEVSPAQGRCLHPRGRTDTGRARGGWLRSQEIQHAPVDWCVLTSSLLWSLLSLCQPQFAFPFTCW